MDTSGSTNGYTHPLYGRLVVLDVSSLYVYVGRLGHCDDRHFVLEAADVHDLRDTSTTRVLYVVDVKRHGVQPNRKRVYVRAAEVVSLSALDDVND